MGPSISVVWCNAGRRTGESGLGESGECRDNVRMGLPGLDLAVVCGNAYPVKWFIFSAFIKYVIIQQLA